MKKWKYEGRKKRRSSKHNKKQFYRKTNHQTKNKKVHMNGAKFI